MKCYTCKYKNKIRKSEKTFRYHCYKYGDLGFSPFTKYCDEYKGGLVAWLKGLSQRY